MFLNPSTQSQKYKEEKRKGKPHQILMAKGGAMPRIFRELSSGRKHITYLAIATPQDNNYIYYNNTDIIMNEKQQPFVSCIMPTYNRRQFVPHAIRYFLRQDYENKELIIIDDGTDEISDLLPDIDFIRYFRLDEKITLGAKLNLACKYARGTIIANWDDDDWYCTRRLTYQINMLQNARTEVCGINKLLYYDLRNHKAYQYTYPPDQRVWLLGSSLCYTKDLWSSNRFAEINVGMDGLFVWATSPERIKVLPDSTIAVHMIHDKNVSPKKTDGAWWSSYPVDEIKKLMNTDWAVYVNGSLTSSKKNIEAYSIQKSPATDHPKQLKNVYACLVHENEDCIIDLVRNLHYHDPASTIVLYNGSENPDLLKSAFPYEKFGAVFHPSPVAVKHGYLHTFALNSMQFSLDNFSFDSFTIVDSDQLAIRQGYSEYLGAFLSSNTNIGMLSSKPEQITTNKITVTDNEAWPAYFALNEYELWKPLLLTFPQGKSKFVHWTFWPSTVFTCHAVKDLVNLFKTNKLLQEIMQQSKIWATEEVILPTLVRLLGYDIALNPCKYDFVKYRKSFSAHDVNLAFNKNDVYWLHPVERKYENPLRKQVRQKFNNYVEENKIGLEEEKVETRLFLRTPLINQVRKIEGWLDDCEAELLINLTLQVCRDIPGPHSIVEIGSYHGKSTVLFGSVVKEFFPGIKIVAIDPHDGKLGATDAGIQTFPPSYEMFRRNIKNANIGDVVEIVKNTSGNVGWDKPVSLLFIDGLHDYPGVAGDFYHFEKWISCGGYVAFHDYADYYPGVKALVQEILETGAYRKIHKVESLMVLQKLPQIVSSEK